MMIKYENECCDCDLPCRGASCSRRNVPHYYCDGCGEEDDIYYFDDGEYCKNCIDGMLQKVEV